jgi:rSAM/selenodomain-associated transferase 1
MEMEGLIIFVRKPELGKVKTRLAAAIGPEAALAIYHKLIAHTYTITSSLRCHKFVFYADAIEENDVWSNGYFKSRQSNSDLGGRMKAAFAGLLARGYERVCIVGSDCFELTSELIREAFACLNNNELVIGPARDGGYYLLGMENSLKEVFDGIEWSTEKVLEQTIKQIEQHHYTYTLLPMLTDVDTVNDLPEEILSGL